MSEEAERQERIEQIQLRIAPNMRVVVEPPEVIMDACAGYADSMERGLWVEFGKERSRLGLQPLILIDGHAPRSRDYSMSRIFNALTKDGWEVAADESVGLPTYDTPTWEVVVVHKLRDLVVTARGFCHLTALMAALIKTQEVANRARIVTPEQA